MLIVKQLKFSTLTVKFAFLVRKTIHKGFTSLEEGLGNVQVLVMLLNKPNHRHLSLCAIVVQS